VQLQEDSSQQDIQLQLEDDDYGAFHTITTGAKLTRVAIAEGELLNLMRTLSSACLYHETYEEELALRCHEYPFTKLTRLCFATMLAQEESNNDSESLLLGNLSVKTLKDIRELDLCLITASNNVGYLDRLYACRNGVARFDDMPDLFPPGTLLVDGGQSGTEKYVVVLSC
jgi:hypothetical protein